MTVKIALKDSISHDLVESVKPHRDSGTETPPNDISNYGKYTDAIAYVPFSMIDLTSWPGYLN